VTRWPASRCPTRNTSGAFAANQALRRRVWVGGHEGAPPERVASELAAFEQTLQRAVAALDARYPRAEALDTDGLAAVIDLCAWAHAEWVRIHPFANGNGRTARIWANALLMRYGLLRYKSEVLHDARRRDHSDEFLL